MTQKQPPKAPAKKKAAKKAVTVRPPAPDPEEPHLPTGIGDDLIPVSMLVRYTTFVEHYLQTLDCAAAAKEAGWIGKNAAAQRSLGGRLLHNPQVRTMIERQYRAIMAKTGATVERVWEEISYVAFCDPADAYDDKGRVKLPSEMPEHVRRALTKYKEGEFGVEVAFGGKDAALDKLMRMHKMADNDKMVLVNGDEFVRAMEEGRQRAERRGK